MKKQDEQTQLQHYRFAFRVTLWGLVIQTIIVVIL